MTPKQKLKWEKAKAKGKPRFVIENALAFGLGVAVSAALHQFFWKNDPPADFWSIFTFIALSFILPAFCATLGALLYWERSEKT
jgi:hypothetical protein